MYVPSKLRGANPVPMRAVVVLDAAELRSRKTGSVQSPLPVRDGIAKTCINRQKRPLACVG